MRLTLCVRFAIVFAVLNCHTALATGHMADEEEKESRTATLPLVSLLKDTKNVRSQEFLLRYDLDDITGSRDAYLRARSEWLEFAALLEILDPLIDYAAASNGVPWAEKDKTIIGVHDGVGGKSGLKRRVTGVTNICKYYNPPPL